jgi:hypothetical protein
MCNLTDSFLPFGLRNSGDKRQLLFHSDTRLMASYLGDELGLT